MGQNTKVVQQAYDAFGRGDIGGLLALLDDAVEWSSPKTLPHGGEFHGPAGVGIGDLGGDTVVGIVRADGTRSGGSADSYGAVHLFTVGDGKITRFREYTDFDAASL